MRRLFGFFAAVLVLAAALPAAAEKRVALIVGNDSYVAVNRLANAVNDAKAMDQALKQAGFETILKTDVTRRDLYRAIDEFAGKIGGDPDTVGLFYYAGHGVQADGSNYLIPVDADIAVESDLKAEAVEAQEVLSVMAEAHNRMNVVILDACRDNPLPKGRSAVRGLARMDAPSGTFIAYAAAPGQVAEDGAKGGNGVFTGELVKAMVEPGVPIEQVFKKVIAGVSTDTAGRQVPWTEASLQGDFYFKNAEPVTAAPSTAPVLSSPAAAPAPPASDQAAIELAFWDSIKDSKDPADFQAYLKKYPKGDFAGLAANRLKLLQQAAVPKPVPAPQVAATPAPGAPQPPPTQPRSAAQVAVVTPPQPPKPESSGAAVPGKVFRDCADCPEMVVVPSGKFTMGAPAAETAREGVPDNIAPNERPQHEVTVSSFALGKYAVTRGEFAAFVAATGYDPKGCNVSDGNQIRLDENASWRDPNFDQTDRHPVVCVTWDDAQAYIKWLSAKTGQRYRLPSEAEWEYAARAGTTTARYWGDDPNLQCDYANGSDLTAKEQYAGWTVANCRDGYVHTAPVGSFRPNPWGLYDMLGNAWQLTADCWNKNYSGAPADGSAWTGGDCGKHAARGGAWPAISWKIRSAHRIWFETGIRSYITGFRLARALSGEVGTGSP